MLKNKSKCSQVKLSDQAAKKSDFNFQATDQQTEPIWRLEEFRTRQYFTARHLRDRNDNFAAFKKLLLVQNLVGILQISQSGLAKKS